MVTTPPPENRAMPDRKSYVVRWVIRVRGQSRVGGIDQLDFASGHPAQSAVGHQLQHGRRSERPDHPRPPPGPSDGSARSDIATHCRTPLRPRPRKGRTFPPAAGPRRWRVPADFRGMRISTSMDCAKEMKASHGRQKKHGATPRCPCGQQRGIRPVGMRSGLPTTGGENSRHIRA